MIQHFKVILISTMVIRKKFVIAGKRQCIINIKNSKTTESKLDQITHLCFRRLNEGCKTFDNMHAVAFAKIRI